LYTHIIHELFVFEMILLACGSDDPGKCPMNNN